VPKAIVDQYGIRPGDTIDWVPDGEVIRVVPQRRKPLAHLRRLMPRVQRWDNLPAAVPQHLIDRMGYREIGVSDLNRLRLWIETRPEVPEGDWYKDFGSFKICGSGSYPQTFLL